MPVFEYRCRSCSAKFSLLIGMVAAPDEEKCPKCSSLDIARLVSRFRRGRSDDDRMDELSERIETMGEPESASEMRHLVKEMAAAGDDEDSAGLEEMLEADLEGGGGEAD